MGVTVNHWLVGFDSLMRSQIIPCGSDIVTRLHIVLYGGIGGRVHPKGPINITRP